MTKKTKQELRSIKPLLEAYNKEQARIKHAQAIRAYYDLHSGDYNASYPTCYNEL